MLGPHRLRPRWPARGLGSENHSFRAVRGVSPRAWPRPQRHGARGSLVRPILRQGEAWICGPGGFREPLANAHKPLLPTAAEIAVRRAGLRGGSWRPLPHMAGPEGLCAPPAGREGQGSSPPGSGSAAPPAPQKIMHTRKRHQDMFQDLSRKLQHAEKDKDALGSDSKVWSGRGLGALGGVAVRGGLLPESPSPPPSFIRSFLPPFPETGLTWPMLDPGGQGKPTGLPGQGGGCLEGEVVHWLPPTEGHGRGSGAGQLPPLQAVPLCRPHSGRCSAPGSPPFPTSPL